MIIDFHNHFYPLQYLNSLEKGRFNTWTETASDGQMLLKTDTFQNELEPAHHDPQLRIAEMDKHGIDMQVLSPTIPGVHHETLVNGIQMAQSFNDEMAAVIAQHPDRFSGLAILPLQDPAAAVIELERAVTQLGLKGGTLFTHINGNQIDDAAYWPIYERAIELDVPLWMHPTMPQHLDGMADYSIVVVAGFMHETTVAMCRMIYSGVLERYADLKFVVGQMGGTLPFLAERIERGYEVYAGCQENLSTSPTELLKRLYMDTTPFTPNAIKFAADFVGCDQILMGSDFPQGIGDTAGALSAIRQLPFSDEDKANMLGGNAARLLKL
ncbi:MAG: amidohydrolase family protein [Anaerolineae bacterium]